MKLTASDLIQRYENTKSKKANFDAVVDDVVKYLMPMRKSPTSPTTPGTKQTLYIFDSDPVRSLLNLAAQLHALMTDPQSQWFELETDNDDLNEQQDVQEWLEYRSRTLKREMDRSNFDSQIHEYYIDLPSVCTAGMFIKESSRMDRVLNFHTLPYSELNISEDEDGYIDTIYRDVRMTARKMYQRWGQNAPKEALSAYEKGSPEEPFQALHCVMPRHERRIGRKDNLNMPIADIWVDMQAKRTITEGGFHEWPFAISRWYVASGETHGRGPGIDNIGDIKTLNKMVKALLRTGQKIADPPLAVPHEGFLGDWKLYPGGLNYFDATSLRGNQPFYEIAPVNRNMPITLDLLQDRRDGVRAGFYTNQLQLVDRREMTAEEVRQRSLANMRIIGPSFGRQQTEMLDPMVIRSYGICDRAGMFNGMETPRSLIDAGASLKIRYVGPLAKAMKAQEVQALTLSIDTALSFHERHPEAQIMDNYDLDEAIRMVHDMDGAPASVLRKKRGENSVEQIRQVRLEQVQKQAELEQQNLAAQTNKTQAEGRKVLRSA